ncbi:MAG: hypothetical protein J5817_07030, partial [Treponema sp.]|nr:hypothetical protein [Treponema sp.]
MNHFKRYGLKNSFFLFGPYFICKPAFQGSASNLYCNKQRQGGRVICLQKEHVSFRRKLTNEKLHGCNFSFQ